MMNLTEKSAELYQNLQKQLASNTRSQMEREERISNCEMEFSDGSLSTWANGLTDRLIQQKLSILNNGGVAEFEALLTLDGEDTKARLVQTRYGLAWRLPNGMFVSKAKKQATYEKKGYRTGFVKKPAWAKITGSGTGLAGALSCYVCVFPSDKNFAQLH